MRRLLAIVVAGVIGVAGCGSTQGSRQGQIEGQMQVAVHQGRPAEDINRLVQEAEDPSQAARVAVWAVMDLEHMPSEIRKTWSYYRRSDPSSTPSVETYEIINRYKISVLGVLARYGVDLNQDYTGRPMVFWAGWGSPPMTPELLSFLLDHGYDPNPDGGLPSALGFCAEPGQSFLRYDHKYEMIRALLEHGANPDVTSLGMPILHELILYNRDNPHLLAIIELLLEAGADVNVVDKRGHTPLDTALACDEDNDLTSKIVATLKRFDAKKGVEL